MGFRPLSEVLQSAAPFHRKVFFLEGYTDSANLYALKAEFLTLIDAANDYTAFLELAGVGLQPSMVRKVALTHGHYDHALGTLELLNHYEALRGQLEVLMHPSGPATLKKLVREQGGTIREIGDGERLDLGGLEVEVLYTPGHTADSVCFYERESRTLFTGDSVLTVEGSLPMPDPAAGGGIADYLSSLRRLASLDIDYVCPGHGLPRASEGRVFVRGVYEEAIRSVRGPEASWSDGATKFMANGLLEEAIFCCDKELEVDPTNLDCLEMKASCLGDLGRGEEATSLYDRVMALGRRSPSVLVGKGFTLLRLDRLEESLACFDEALQGAPGSEEASVGRGITLWLLGRQEEAFGIPEFEKAFSGKLTEELRKLLESRTKNGA